MDEYIAPACQVVPEKNDPDADVPKDEPGPDHRSDLVCAILIDDGSAPKTSRVTSHAIVLATQKFLSFASQKACSGDVGEWVLNNKTMTLRHHGIGHAVQTIANTGVSIAGRKIFALRTTKPVIIRGNRRAAQFCKAPAVQDASVYTVGPSAEMQCPPGTWSLTQHGKAVVLRGVTAKIGEMYAFSAHDVSAIINCVAKSTMCACNKAYSREPSEASVSKSSSTFSDSKAGSKTRSVPSTSSSAKMIKDTTLARNTDIPRNYVQEWAETVAARGAPVPPANDDARSTECSSGRDDEVTEPDRDQVTENVDVGLKSQTPAQPLPRVASDPAKPSLQSLADTIAQQFGVSESAAYSIAGLLSGITAILLVVNVQSLLDGSSSVSATDRIDRPVTINIYNQPEQLATSSRPRRERKYGDGWL